MFLSLAWDAEGLGELHRSIGQLHGEAGPCIPSTRCEHATQAHFSRTMARSLQPVREKSQVVFEQTKRTSTERTSGARQVDFRSWVKYPFQLMRQTMLVVYARNS